MDVVNIIHDVLIVSGNKSEFVKEAALYSTYSTSIKSMATSSSSNNSSSAPGTPQDVRVYLLTV